MIYIINNILASQAHVFLSFILFFVFFLCLTWISLHVCGRNVFQAQVVSHTSLVDLTFWSTTGAKTLIWMSGWKMQRRYRQPPPLAFPHHLEYTISNCIVFCFVYSGGASEQTGRDHRRWPVQVGLGTFCLSYKADKSEVKQYISL